MQNRRTIAAGVRLVLVAVVFFGAVALFTGCSRFDAAKPMWEEYSSSEDLSQSMTAFLKWCEEEAKGDPQSLGP